MSTPKRIAIVGAGGFAREVEWLIREINEANGTPLYDFKGYLVSEITKLGITDSVDEVLGDFSWVEANQDALDAVAIGIGNPQARLRLGLEIRERFPFLKMPTLIHPNVRIDRSSLNMGEGVIICAGVIGTVNIRIEDFVAINLGCTIGHEAQIGRGVVLNPTVNISGGVTIRDSVLIGTGAQVLQNLSVGEGATVGAGSVVTKTVAASMTVVGAPARPLDRKQGGSSAAPEVKRSKAAD